jgi:hypothetical protein
MLETDVRGLAQRRCQAQAAPLQRPRCAWPPAVRGHPFRRSVTGARTLRRSWQGESGSSRSSSSSSSGGFWDRDRTEGDSGGSHGTGDGEEHPPQSASSSDGGWYGSRSGRVSPQQQQPYSSYGTSSPGVSGGGSDDSATGGSSSSSSGGGLTGFLQALPSFSRSGPEAAGAGSPLGSMLARRLASGAGGGSWGGGRTYGPRGNPGRGPPPVRAAGSGYPGLPSAAAPQDGGTVSPWVVAALAPLCVWTLTWGLTSGLAHLADACMGGMCGVARLLFPVITVRWARPSSTPGVLQSAAGAWREGPGR